MGRVACCAGRRCACVSQSFQKGLQVPVVLENLLSVVAPGHQVIHRAGILNADQPRHVAATLESSVLLSLPKCHFYRTPLT